MDESCSSNRMALSCEYVPIASEQTSKTMELFTLAKGGEGKERGRGRKGGGGRGRG